MDPLNVFGDESPRFVTLNAQAPPPESYIGLQGDAFRSGLQNPATVRGYLRDLDKIYKNRGPSPSVLCVGLLLPHGYSPLVQWYRERISDGYVASTGTMVIDEEMQYGDRTCGVRGS